MNASRHLDWSAKAYPGKNVEDSSDVELQRTTRDLFKEAAALSSMADSYYAQGKYEEAEPLLKRVLAIYKRKFGEAHPITADILNDLGAIYYDQGKYEQAEPLLRCALSIYEGRSGEKYPALASALNNLALLSQVRGRDEEAEWLAAASHRAM